MIEDAYIDARYTTRGFTEEETREALVVSLKLIKLLEEIEKTCLDGLSIG